MSDNNNPVTREEMYLSAAAGNDTELPEPITRKELFLAKAAGADVQTPEPITREEMFLSRITGGGSGGGGGGSVRLQNKTFNANGTYKADAGYDGLGTVTVDVAGSGGADEDWIIGDGNTHLWITLPEGRTSPMLGVCPNGTVTVDWGDGSTPDVLTGTSTSTVQWTPNHEYAAAGDYVITLTVDGEMGFSGQSSSGYYAHILRNSPTYDPSNICYQNSLQRIEFGNGVTNIQGSAFNSCYSLTSIAIPASITEIAAQVFRTCRSLENISIPDGVTSIGDYAFADCSSLADINIPNGVRTVGTSTFDSCYSLASVIIPDGVTSIGDSAFRFCYSLRNVYVPDSVKSIGSYAFNHCDSLGSITIPGEVTKIQTRAFQYCYSMKFCDFTKHTAVPTLAATDAFSNIPADCEIRVPAALADEWKAATNWSTYADKIVGV